MKEEKPCCKIRKILLELSKAAIPILTIVRMVKGLFGGNK